MSREHADSNRSSSMSALADAPEWVLHRVKREKSRRRMPETIKAKYRQLDRLEGLCPSQQTASRDIARRERLLAAMADDSRGGALARIAARMRVT